MYLTVFESGGGAVLAPLPGRSLLTPPRGIRYATPEAAPRRPAASGWRFGRAIPPAAVAYNGDRLPLLTGGWRWPDVFHIPDGPSLGLGDDLFFAGLGDLEFSAFGFRGRGLDLARR